MGNVAGVERGALSGVCGLQTSKVGRTESGVEPLKVQSELTAGGEPQDLVELSPVAQSLLGPVGQIVGAIGQQLERIMASPHELGADSIPILDPTVAEVARQLVAKGEVEPQELSILQAPIFGGKDQNILVGSDGRGGLEVRIGSHRFHYDPEEAKGLIIACGPQGGKVETHPDVKLPLHLAGGKGNDHLEGGQGDDIIAGGAGRDYLYGDRGHDLLLGGAGSDLLYGGPGVDLLRGGAGHDYLQGGLGPDHLQGGAGQDILFGGQGGDHLEGGSGADLLVGGLGRDMLIGGSGPDRLVGGTTEANSDRLLDLAEEDRYEAIEPQASVPGIKITPQAYVEPFPFLDGFYSTYGLSQAYARRFEEQVTDDLESLASLPSGQQLFKALEEHGHPVEIIKTDLENGLCISLQGSQAFSDEQGQPGLGSPALVAYNPSYAQIYDHLPWSEAPPALILAHELSHAYNSTRGDMDPRQAIESGNDAQGQFSYPVPAPEFQAVGIPLEGLTPNPPFATENGWRRELNLPPRLAYGPVADPQHSWDSRS